MVQVSEATFFGIVYSAPASAALALLWCWRSRVLRRVLPGCCPNCSYSLAGLRDDQCCPECGITPDATLTDAEVVRPGRTYVRSVVLLAITGVVAATLASVQELARGRWWTDLAWMHAVPFAGIAAALAIVVRRLDGRAATAIAAWAGAITLLYLAGHLTCFVFDPPRGILWQIDYVIVALVGLGVAGHALLLGVAIVSRRATRRLTRPLRQSE